MITERLYFGEYKLKHHTQYDGYLILSKMRFSNGRRYVSLGYVVGKGEGGGQENTMLPGGKRGETQQLTGLMTPGEETVYCDV